VERHNKPEVEAKDFVDPEGKPKMTSRELLLHPVVIARNKQVRERERERERRERREGKREKERERERKREKERERGKERDREREGKKESTEGKRESHKAHELCSFSPSA
jgi:hypothetical protein